MGKYACVLIYETWFAHQKKDNYPVSYMEQILQTISRLEMFSFFNGYSAYNQVLVLEPDRLKITFHTKWGTFTFWRMPFGLVNASVTFQRAMDMAFHGLIGQSVVVYLDDVTMFSKKRYDHLRHLKKILSDVGNTGYPLIQRRVFLQCSRVISWATLLRKVGLN